LLSGFSSRADHEHTDGKDHGAQQLQHCYIDEGSGASQPFEDFRS
jgi:hypothetical protein